MGEKWADAFIDESGHRIKTKKSSDHFVMAAAVVLPGRMGECAPFLAKLRQDLNRQPHHELTWKKLKTHAHRLHAATQIGLADFLQVSAVVVCKRDFDAGKGDMPDEDFAYLYTFRFLLERLSWLARGRGVTLRYTLAQIGQFRLEQLREYEKKLRAIPYPDCQIAWNHLDPAGGKIDQPKRLENLQLADLVASATAPAFEPDEFGNTTTLWLERLSPRLYRYSNGRLLSYGLKMHPWNAKAKSEHPWLLDWK